MKGSHQQNTIIEQSKGNQQVPLGQQIFGNMSVQQQTSLQMNNEQGTPNQMNEAMMQNMMKFFGQQMNQFQMMGGQPQGAQQYPTQNQNQPVGPMSDLEKFYANKVNDMNSFYSQLNLQQPVVPKPENQSTFNALQYQNKNQNQNQNYGTPAGSNKMQTNNYYDEQDQPPQREEFLQQTSKFLNPYQPPYNPQKYCDEETQMRMDNNHDLQQQQSQSYIQKQARHSKQDSSPQDYLQSYQESAPRKINNSQNQLQNYDEIKPNQQQYRQQQNYDEIKPNQQMYKQQQNVEEIRPSYNQQSMYDDDRPIKPNRQIEEPKKYQQQDEERVIRPQKNQIPNNADDDRPIKPSKNIEKDYDEQPHQDRWDDQPIKKEIKKQQKNNDEDRRPTKKNEDDERKFRPQTSFDEQPIKPQSKKHLDDMYDEQPMQTKKPQARHTDGDGQVKSFLKKGTRKFLSNAQQRSMVLDKEQEDVGVIDYMQDLKKGSKKRADSPPIKSRFTETNLYQQPPSGVKKANKENQQQKVPQRQQKKQQSYLSKGEGKGGGKGNGNNLKSEDGKPGKKYSDDETPTDDMYKNEFEEPEYKFDDEQDWKTNEFEALNKKKEVNKKQPSKPSQNNDYSDEEQPSPQPIGKQQKIVQKYFGGDKDKKQVVDDMSPPQLTQIQEEEIVRKYVQGKIDSLNGEITKFKGENDRVRKQRIKYEDQIKSLTKEREEWEKQKETERQQLEDWKEEEKKKMNREKKVQDRATKTFQNVPTRKEREELEQLKKQLDKQNEEVKAKETKNKLNYDRVKKQCEDFQQRNLELQAEVKALESVRIHESSQGKKPTVQVQQSQQQQHSQSQQQQHQNTSVQSSKQATQQQAQTKSVAPSQQQSKMQQQLDSDEEEDYQEDEERSLESEDEYDQIVNVPDNAKKVQFVQSSFNNQNQNNSMQSQKSPKRNETNSQGQGQGQKTNSKRQYDIISVGDIGRMSIKHINRLISENEFCFDQNKFYQNYSQSKDQLSKIISQNVGADGKIQRIFANGKKEVIFHNGVKREVFQDGYTIVHFTNSDIKQTLPNGTIIYFFADANTTQTTLPSGPNIYRFQNQQIEIHFQDGSKEIKFSDGTEKFIHINGEEETMFSDGIFQRIDTNKVKYIEYPNGNIDVIYPDGQKVRQHKSKDN